MPQDKEQVPAIQRYKIGYHADEWGVRSSTPSGIPDASGAWVRYEDHVTALKAAPAHAGEYPALVCDYCGALTPDPWHRSGMPRGKMSKHIHSCDACCRGATQPSPAAQGDALSDDAVRVPLDNLHADAAYLIGRLREGSMPYARVIEIIRERIDAAKAAIRARAPADSVLEDAADPLQGAANWLAEAHGQFCVAVLQGCLMIGYNRAKRLHDVAIAARKQGANHD